jgi:hypothetical protein
MMMARKNSVDRKSATSKARGRAAMTLASTTVVETLENRTLLASMGMSNGLLTVLLDNGRTNEFLLRNINGGAAYEASLNGQTSVLDKNQISQIVVHGGDQADLIDIQASITRPTTLIGNAGNDTIRGGNGVDVIFGGDGADVIDGRGSGDTLIGGPGADIIYGGDGNDAIWGDEDNDSIYGGNGNDKIDGRSGTDFVDGGAGTDMALNAENRVSIETTSGSMPTKPSQPARPGSTSGTVTPPSTGGSAPSAPTTGLPDDMVLGNDGKLTVTLANGRTNNFYIREENNNGLWTITVNGRNNTIAKSSVTSLEVNGGDRADNIDVGRTFSGSTTLRGNAGNDTFKGGSGNDLIYGGDGNDYIEGRDGNDSLYGEAGNDTLLGGNGNDYLDGGSGTDRLDGGAGTDTGVFGETLISIENGGSSTPAPTPPPPTPTTPPSTGSTPAGGISGQTYNIFDGMAIAGSTDMNKMIGALRDLGVQRVRIGYSTSSYDNRGANQWAIDRAIAFKNAGFQVMMFVLSPKDTQQVPDPSKVKAYFQWLVQRPGLRDAVDLWQIGNEPNITKYWKGTLPQYVNNLLKPASEALRAAGQKVVGAGPTWDINAAKALVAAGYNNYVDYAAFHPYGNTPEQVRDRAKGAKEAYGNKPMIITEWNIRNTPNKTEWADKVKNTRNLLKPYAEFAFYYALTVTNSMAGPAGLIYDSGAKNQPFYDVARQWKYDTSTHGNLFA